VNGKRANSSALTEGSEHHRYLHHQRLRELQNKLLSPQVMKRFSSQNLKRIIQNRKKSNNILDVFSKNVSEANSARGGTRVI
jgi:predicted nucleic acid-binding protein